MATATKARRYTWRKGKLYDGRMRLAPSYTLHHGSDDIIVHVQAFRTGGWYWYGLGQNTAGEPKSLEDAQADALAFVKAHSTSASQ